MCQVPEAGCVRDLASLLPKHTYLCDRSSAISAYAILSGFEFPAKWILISQAQATARSKRVCVKINIWPQKGLEGASLSFFVGIYNCHIFDSLTNLKLLTEFIIIP